MATVASVFFVYQLYRELPPLPTALTEPISQNLFIKNRFLNLLNQLVHQLFSSNFLVPLFALRGGFAVAGQLKLVCYISYGITSALQKIIGFSASALFAQFVGKESKNTLARVAPNQQINMGKKRCMSVSGKPHRWPSHTLPT